MTYFSKSRIGEFQFSRYMSALFVVILVAVVTQHRLLVGFSFLVHVQSNLGLDVTQFVLVDGQITLSFQCHDTFRRSELNAGFLRMYVQTVLVFAVGRRFKVDVNGVVEDKVFTDCHSFQAELVAQAEFAQINVDF